MKATKIAAWVVGAVFLAPFVLLGDSLWRSRHHVSRLFPDAVSGWTFLWLAAAGVVSLALLANPKGLWWKLFAWRFKNPGANEPSDAFYTVMRLAGLVGAFVVAIALLEQYLDYREYQEWEARWHGTASGQHEPEPGLPRRL